MKNKLLLLASGCALALQTVSAQTKMPAIQANSAADVGDTYATKLVTIGNNTINTANPYMGDVVVGSDLNGGIRHDGSIMWWSNGSASRISNTADVFYLSQWNTTTPNIGLSAIIGGASYFNGNVAIGMTSPKGKLDINGGILLQGATNNVTARPVAGTARIAGEIAAYSKDSFTQDDGFLRLSAGGGTSSVKSFIDLTGYSTLPDMDRNIVLGTGGKERVRVNSLGYVGIGTANPDAMLAVNGTIHSRAVKVDASGWPDYVFQKDHRLPPLSEVEAYIHLHEHLPEIPSEQEIAKTGLDLGEMNKLLVKKVEELTLYLISKDHEGKEQQQALAEQQRQINYLLGQVGKFQQHKASKHR